MSFKENIIIYVVIGIVVIYFVYKFTDKFTGGLFGKDLTEFPKYNPEEPCPYGKETQRSFFFGDCPPNYRDRINWFNPLQTPICECVG